MTILLWGIPSEPPLAMVKTELEKLGAPLLMFNQRQFARCDIDLEIHDGVIGGRLHVEGYDYPLAAFTAAYLRPMDDTQLPEIVTLPADAAQRRHCRALHDLVLRWLDLAPGRIVNRPQPMGSNMSKPYQAQLIRQCGFDVPETLITNEPDRVHDFRRRHGRVIYKSISGVRSIVRELEEGDLARLVQIRSCPTQFQAYIEGYDVRVHTIGESVFATRADTNVADYRYAPRQAGGETRLSAIELPPALRARCIALSTHLGLDFAGIDLKVAPDGRVYCFEVNPCPAFSYYEANTDQPIAQALAKYLAGA